MKLTLQHRHDAPTAAFTDLVRTELTAVASGLRIDEAKITVERQREASPPIRISAHLVTPGPDVMAEAQDHTLRAALTKLLRAIRGKIGHRAGRRNRRHRSHISGRVAPSHA